MTSIKSAYVQQICLNKCYGMSSIQSTFLTNKSKLYYDMSSNQSISLTNKFKLIL